MSFDKILSLPKRYPGLILFAFAFFIRAWNINADLPNLYVADEPHHINMAARMGSGDLNPHDFKYPSLWKYTLAGLFGTLYAGSRVLGKTSSPMDFAGSFFIDPTLVYFSARLLAAFLFALGSYVLFRIGEKFYDRKFGWLAGLFLALSPAMYPFGRDATMNALMVFLVIGAIYCLHNLTNRGNVIDYVSSGVLIGLSISTHYIAGPISVLILTSHFLRKDRKWNHLFIGLISIPIGFILGSPYFLLDAQNAFRDIGGMAQLHVETIGKHVDNDLALRTDGQIKQWQYIIKNTVSFLDPWGIGLLLALVGFFSVPLSTVWLLPMLLTLPVLIGSYHGGFYRYSLAVYLPLIIPATLGAQAIARKLRSLSPKLTVITLVILLTPAFLFMLRSNRELKLADTRTMAEEWINKNIPEGEKILLADPFNCPQIPFSKNQVERLYKRTAELNHPREKYYQAILTKHAGGGYEVFYLRRSLGEVEDIPKRTEAAYQALDTLDPVQDGISGFKKEGIRAVVLYADIEKNERHQPWVNELKKSASESISFNPKDHEIKGPPIEIFVIGRASEKAVPAQK